MQPQPTNLDPTEGGHNREHAHTPSCAHTCEARHRSCGIQEAVVELHEDSHLENNEQQIWRVSSLNLILLLLYVWRCMVSPWRPPRLLGAWNRYPSVREGKEVCQLDLRAHARWLAASGVSCEEEACCHFTIIVNKWQKIYNRLRRGCARFPCVSLTREERRPQILGVWVVKWRGRRAWSLHPNWTDTREAS